MKVSFFIYTKSNQKKYLKLLTKNDIINVIGEREMLDIKLQSTKIGDTVKKYKINYIVNNDIKENKNFKMMTFIKNKYDKFIHIVLKYDDITPAYIIATQKLIQELYRNDKKFYIQMKSKDIYADYYDPFFKYNRILFKRIKESQILMNGM